MGIELDSDTNSKVSFTEPVVKEEENRVNLNDEILGVSAKKYEQLQVELAECRNRIEELKFHHDEEKAGKEQTSKTLATYEKKTRDERQQYVQQINSLEIIVMMLKLKAKISANHASRLEERLQELKTENEQLQSHCDFMMNILIEGDYEMDTEQRNKVASSKNSTVSRNTAVKPYSSHSEQVNTSTKSNTRLDSTNINQPSSGKNPYVATIIFETPPNFNFINQIPTQGQIFRFSADTSNTGAVAVQRNFKKVLSIASTTAASTTASSIFVFGKPTASDNSLKVCSPGTERKNPNSNSSSSFRELLLMSKIKYANDLIAQRNYIKAKRRLPRN